MVGKDDNAPLRLFSSYRCTFAREPMEILRVSLVIVLDSPIFDSLKVTQTPLHGICRRRGNVGPQGTAEDGHLVGQIKTSSVE